MSNFINTTTILMEATFKNQDLLELFIEACKKHKLIMEGIISKDSDPPFILTCIRVPDQNFIKEVLWPYYQRMCSEFYDKMNKENNNV